jgi:hypothetical protein
VGYEALARTSKFLSDYVSFRLDALSQNPIPFKEAEYNTPYAINIFSLGSHDSSLLKRFPMVQSYSVQNGASGSNPLTLPLPATLRECQISGAEINDQDLLRLRRRCPKIEVLDISDSRELTSRAFSRNLPWRSLQRLDLSFITLRDQDIEKIINLCPNLVRLAVLGCRLFTGSLLAASSRLEFFEELTLSCTPLSAPAFQQVVAGAKRLQRLSIGHCRDIDAQSFATAEYVAPLRTVTLDSTAIQAEGFRKILAIPTLQGLNFSNCEFLQGAFDLTKLNQLYFEGTNVSCVPAAGSPAAKDRN